MEKVVVRGEKKSTIMSIIMGELQNWGYVVSKPVHCADEWGTPGLEIEVKENGES